MLATIIISAAIIAYIVFVVVKQMQKIKKGESGCGCGCSGCTQNSDCHKAD
ncbi:MAG: FeoB-associated Cys-rich membrane protein [Paenibacillaceae bacterium]|nr:FeoB-associated Cys-rich membrane protein [Paenibacillaceae bacterium]